MLDFYVASSEGEIRRLSLPPRMSLDGAVYWFLQRYFVQACLQKDHVSFLNLYEDTEVSGYQLQRLETELHEALIDLGRRGDRFKVLVGWNGTQQMKTAEEWREVGTDKVRQAAQTLLALLAEAQKNNKSVFAVGD